VSTRLALCEIRGSLKQVIDNLSGENAEEWLAVYDLVHRRKNPWPEGQVQPTQSRRRSMFVDMDAAPFKPEGWQTVSNRIGQGRMKVSLRRGVLYLNNRPVELWLSERQKSGRTTIGNDLAKEWGLLPNLLNANLLDWLLREENQRYIPKSWKGKGVFFPGTEYRGPGGRLVVRCLSWFGGQWRWCWYGLGDHWGESSPAALLVSPLGS
jgi:hypothetical protein